MPNFLERLASSANKKRKQVQSAVVDVVDANTEDDQKRRMAAGQPRMYQDQQRQQASPVTIRRAPMVAPTSPISIAQPSVPKLSVAAPVPVPKIAPVTTAQPQSLTVGNQNVAPSPVAHTNSAVQTRRQEFLNNQNSLETKVKQGLQQKLAVPLAGAQQAKELAQDFVGRPAAQIAASVTNTPTIRATNPITRQLIGNHPVKSIQQSARDAGNVQHKIPFTNTNLPKPIAQTGDVLLNLAQDAPIVGGVAKAGVRALKSSAVTENAAQALQKLVASRTPLNEGGSIGRDVRQPTPRPRINLDNQRALRDYSDYLAGTNPARGSELNQIIPKAYDTARVQGTDLATGSRADRLEATNALLDNVGRPAPTVTPSSPNILERLRNGVRPLDENGGINNRVPEPNNLLPNAEDRVFAQNPMNSNLGHLESEIDKTKTPSQTIPSLAQSQRAKIISKDNSPSANSLPIYNTKRVSNLDKATRSTRSIIERQGESGSQLADMLQGSRDTHEMYLAELQKQLPTVTKLARKDRNRLRGGGDFENFVDATQGLAKPRNDNVAKAVQEWQATHPGIRERAVNTGLDVGDLGPKYYPHFIDYDRVFKDKNTYNEAINHLVKTGQAQSDEEAIKLLGYARDVSRNRQFGNLEASREIDLPFYDKTPNSLTSYLNGSARRIAQSETFGSKDENALKLIAKAGQQGYDTEAIKNAYDVAVGAKQYSPTASKISNGIRKYVTTTRLGLGAITNVSQNVNTGIVAGHFRTLASAFKQLSPKTRDFVNETGVISDAVLNDLKTQAGYSSFSQKVLGKTVNKITAPGFGSVEKLNRSIAATAGRDYALRLAQKGDINTLRKLGVKGDIRNRTLTEAQQIQAARRMVEKTQFKVDPQDLPGWTDSPGGKLVSQFRTFSYNQGKFFSNEIIKPLAKGNVLPLGRLLAALPLGYGLYEVRRKIDGRPEEESGAKIALQSFSKVGGAGLVFDLYQSLNPIGSKYIPSDRRTSMAVGAFGGPAVGVAAQAVGALSEGIQRKNTPDDTSRLDGKLVAGKTDDSYTDVTPAARFALQQVPIVGTPIKNRVLPFKKESDADAGKKEIGDSSLANTLENKDKADKDRQKAFKKSLSKEDYELSQLSDKEQQQLVKDGVITQDKLAGLNNYIRNKKTELGYQNTTAGLPKNYDKLDKSVQNYYSTKQDSDEWKNSQTDKNGKDLIRRANQIRPSDLPELPDNNKVASLYADFVKNRQAEKWSPTREVTEKRKLLQAAYKTQLSEDDQFWLSGSDGQLREGIDNGDVTQDRMDQLVAYDNLQATLGGSAQIGKTLRNLLGYDPAPTAKYGATKYSSSGGSKSGGGKKLNASAFESPLDILTKYSIKGANLAASAKLGK